MKNLLKKSSGLIEKGTQFSKDDVRSKIELKNNPRDKARGSDATMSIAKKGKLSSKV